MSNILNQKILRSPDVLLPPEYLSDVLRQRAEPPREIIYHEEYSHFNKDLEHSIYRFRDITENYRAAKKPVDDEFTAMADRLVEAHSRLQRGERRTQQPDQRLGRLPTHDRRPWCRRSLPGQQILPPGPGRGHKHRDRRRPGGSHCPGSDSPNPVPVERSGLPHRRRPHVSGPLGLGVRHRDT
mgnify:CR=1 FL=1